jgi:hypothetical protein
MSDRPFESDAEMFAWLDARKNAMPRPYQLMSDLVSEVMELEVHVMYGLIPLLEMLQKKHPEFEEECVFRALESLRESRDAIGPLTTELHKHVEELYPVLP